MRNLFISAILVFGTAFSTGANELGALVGRKVVSDHATPACVRPTDLEPFDALWRSQNRDAMSHLSCMVLPAHTEAVVLDAMADYQAQVGVARTSGGALRLWVSDSVWSSAEIDRGAGAARTLAGSTPAGETEPPRSAAAEGSVSDTASGADRARAIYAMSENARDEAIRRCGFFISSTEKAACLSRAAGSGDKASR